MPIISSKEQFINTKTRSLIDIKCDKCSKEFKRKKNLIFIYAKNRLTELDVENIYSKEYFCSRLCSSLARLTGRTIECLQCKKLVYVTKAVADEQKFCSQSCSATYNNAHKTYGTRRSKLEIWLEKELTIKYPNLKLHFNRKDAINSELDIYIPNLKLAFELNGIFHYEPIYGIEKLSQIQNNDTRKFQACLERGIELCIIDSSKLKYNKPEKFKKYLDIISSIIDSKIKTIQ